MFLNDSLLFWKHRDALWWK